MAAPGKNNIKGIRLTTFNRIMLVVACILTAVILLLSANVHRGHQKLQQATELYISSQEAASDMQRASDYLTEQVRLFVVTGNANNLRNYFAESEDDQRRDKAIAYIEEHLGGTSASRQLRAALEASNELMQIEYTAMRFAIAGYGYKVEEFSPALMEAQFSPQDAARSAAWQKQKAIALVFDGTYQAYKKTITQNVSNCIDALEDLTRKEQEKSSSTLLHMIQAQTALLVIMVVLIFVLVVANHRLIIAPIWHGVSMLQKNEQVPERGAVEIRFLARTYNRVAAQIQREQEQLSYDASHDALTGLYNRSIFEKQRILLSDGSATLLLIDFDHFKEINDTYGHEIGDRALKKLAELLQVNFRGSDWICRIGGDEFAVIMIRTGSSLRELIENKVKRINAALADTSDGLPPLSISVGVAFGDRINPTDDIFKDADAALYRAKDAGRVSCIFY